MKTLTFLIITLLSGAIAGTFLGLMNLGLVEPFIDRAIDIENQNSIEAGEPFDPQEYNSYRVWQKGGEILAGTILGISIAALFGVVFVYSRRSLPGSNTIKKVLILAGIMWFVLFLVPALKYPANPPAVGDPETIYYRETLYVSYLAISGLSALGLALLYGRVRIIKAKNVVFPLIYAFIMIAAYLGMPPNPDEITAPMDLVVGFRIASALTMSIFWGILAAIFGSFWDRTRPHETTKVATV
jgi:predicted cobalt transporter CbtA